MADQTTSERDREPELDPTARTSAEQKLATECQRAYCSRQIHDELLVPVTLGEDVTRHWCPNCVEQEFDIDVDQLESGVKPTLYVTTRTVTAFLLGVTLMLVLASVMVW